MISAQRPTSSAQPSIKLFDPGDSGGAGTSSAITLSTLFEEYFVPLWIEARGLSPKTRTAYQESVDWWTKLTSDPPLEAITDFDIAKFVSEMLKQPGRKGSNLKAVTVQRHCRHLNKLLRFAGPRGRERNDRKNVGVLDDPPFVDSPQPDKAPPDGDFTMEELHRLYIAAAKMTRPNRHSIRPVDWWRAILVVAYYTGLRKSELLGLRFNELTPWAGGARIVVKPSTAKGRQGKRKYLPQLALDHIAPLRESGQRWVFWWANWPTSFSNLNVHFTKLLRFAGLSEERAKFHGIRKSHTTQMQAVDPKKAAKLAQKSAGHADMSTTLQHYINGDSSELVLSWAVDALPSPVPEECPPTDRQLLLF